MCDLCDLTVAVASTTCGRRWSGTAPPSRASGLEDLGGVRLHRQDRLDVPPHL